MKEKIREAKLFRALGDIDDDLCEEAAVYAREKSVVRRRARVKTVLIAAAVLIIIVVLTLGTVAATAYDVGFYISQYFGGELEMLDEMTAIPQNIRYRSTNDDVKLVVTGVTGDANYAYIWFDIILPEGGDYTDLYMHFEVFHMSVMVNNGSLSFSDGMLAERKADNVFSFFCNVQMDARLPGRRVMIELVNIRAYSTDFLIEGKWSARFSLNYDDLTQELEPDVSGAVIAASYDEFLRETDGIAMEYEPRLAVDGCHIKISPMSMKLTFDYTSDSSKPFYMPQSAVLRFSDGSEISCKSKSGGSEYINEDKGGMYYTGFIFKEPINPKDIVAVIYGGVTIRLD